MPRAPIKVRKYPDEPYVVENVREMEKRFDNFLATLPKGKYSYPEIIHGFLSSIFRKALAQSNQSEEDAR